MTVAARRVNARKTAGYPIIRSVVRVIAMAGMGDRDESESVIAMLRNR